MTILSTAELKNVDFGALISYTRPFPAVSFLAFLEAMPISPRIYWESGLVDVEFAGGGAAAEIFASGGDRFEQIQQKLDDLFRDIVVDSTAPDALLPRVFGGFAFRDDYKPASVWSAFPSAYFVLPRYQITRMEGETWLTINRRLMPFEHAESALDSLAWEFESVQRRVQASAEAMQDERPTVEIEGLNYPLPKEVWREQIIDVTGRMKAHEFEKVVLSRTIDLKLSEPPNLLAALERMGARYPHTFRFLIEPAAGRSFFGASPELLVNVRGKSLHTAALASSRKRGNTDEEDAALAHDLMTSPKDRHEHGVVVDFLRDQLVPLTTALDVPNTPAIMKLTNILHLHTPVSGILREGVSLLKLARALHPTPALGGYPQAKAVDVIQQTETVSRGWFAAPIGWIDGRGDGMFAVAIRSAVSSGAQVRLYAGAGIVADSDPDKEWDEIEWKFQPMRDALGVMQS